MAFRGRAGAMKCLRLRMEPQKLARVDKICPTAFPTYKQDAVTAGLLAAALRGALFYS